MESKQLDPPSDNSPRKANAAPNVMGDSPDADPTRDVPPEPGTPEHVARGGTYPNVDPIDGAIDDRGDVVTDHELARLSTKWPTPERLKADVEKHIKESHGSEGDKQMIRDLLAILTHTVLRHVADDAHGLI